MAKLVLVSSELSSGEVTGQPKPQGSSHTTCRLFWLARGDRTDDPDDTSPAVDSLESLLPSLWLFIFSLPLALMTEFPVCSGTVSKVTGLSGYSGMPWAAVVARKQVRVLEAVHMTMGGFILWSAVTLCWSVNPQLTVQRMMSYVPGLCAGAPHLGTLPGRERRAADSRRLRPGHHPPRDLHADGLSPGAANPLCACFVRRGSEHGTERRFCWR